MPKVTQLVRGEKRDILTFCVGSTHTTQYRSLAQIRVNYKFKIFHMDEIISTLESTPIQYTLWGQKMR